MNRISRTRAITLAPRPSRLLVMLALLALVMFVSAGCGSSNDSSKSSKDDPSVTDGGGGGAETTTTSATDASASDGTFDDAKIAKRAGSYKAAPTDKLDPAKTWFADVTTTKGKFTIKLLPKEGPIAASNFASLARDGFYDGITFHRVIKGFMIQTGDPLGTGTGDPGYSIKDDKVTMPYKPGIVAMANSGPDTGGSQFFIVQGDGASSLPPNYAIFGQVTTGMKVIDTIADVPVTTGDSGEASKPTETVRITGITIREG